MPGSSHLPRMLALPRGLSRFAADYLGMLGVLAILVALFGSLSRHFLTAATLSTVANQIPDLTVIAVGMTFVLIIAGIDLSVGSVLALSAAVLGVVVAERHAPVAVGVLACVAVGAGCGLVNGWITVRWSIPSFIVTLGMLEIARGAAYLATQSQTTYIGQVIEPVAAPWPGVGLSPAFFLSVLVVALGQLVLTRTVFGRSAIAVGSNEQAASMSGIRPGRIRLGVFTLVGLLTGLGAWFHTARLAAADPNAGVGMELSAIAAVVIGGTSLMGGRGSVVNSFFGVLIIATLQAGLAQIGASEPIKRVVTGAVIVIAVVADAYRHRLAQSPLASLRQLLFGPPSPRSPQ